MICYIDQGSTFEMRLVAPFFLSAVCMALAPFWNNFNCFRGYDIAMNSSQPGYSILTILMDQPSLHFRSVWIRSTRLYPIWGNSVFQRNYDNVEQYVQLYERRSATIHPSWTRWPQSIAFCIVATTLSRPPILLKSWQDYSDCILKCSASFFN